MRDSSVKTTSFHSAAHNLTAAVAERYRYRTMACLVKSSSPVPLKTHRVGQRCTLNLSRAETSSHWVLHLRWPAGLVLRLPLVERVQILSNAVVFKFLVIEIPSFE
ncbi:hypothetical protein TNCV_1999241 [Trichonephila clavipes]|nr:hypothetical protein TNCV_1999241 [Trichonephila clavipes]